MSSFGVVLMVKTKPKTTDEIFAKVDDDKKQLAENLRNFVKATLPKAVETIRQGRITYAVDGKDVAGIRLTKQHVDLLFLRSSSLSSTVLKGQGTIGDPKHIEVYAMKNFDQAEAKRLLLEEAALVSSPA
jgi:hypothetical protein